MESWGPGVFDNEYAAEWGYELNSPSGLAHLRAALAAAREGYLEEDEAALALAAGALVAAALDDPLPGVPGDLAAWADSHTSSLLPLVRPALRAVRLAVSSSALMDEWEHEGRDEAISGALDLRRQLERASRRLRSLPEDVSAHTV